MPLRRLLLHVALAAWLAACALTTTPPGPTPTSEPGRTATVPATPQGAATAAASATAPAEGAPVTLRVWLPPDFAPDINSPSGRLLASQISAFEDAYPGVAVEVRIKAASGPGGLLNALSTAANVAPGVLPNLVALRRDDLAAAAAAGLVVPLETLLPADLLADYYPFAQAMGRANGGWAGLPFAADARVLVYLTSDYASPPLAWTDIVTGTLALPGGETSGLTVLNVYQALGGTLADEDGQTRLEPEPLTRALEIFHGLQAAGRLGPATLDYADTTGTWEAFRDNQATLAVTSAQRYLAEYFRVEGAAATLLPAPAGLAGLTTAAPMALADGWSWAVVNTQADRQPLGAALLAWLAAPERHSAWTEAAQVLPTRAATLAGWQAERLVPFVSDVVINAQLQPSAAVLAEVGPPLRQALGDVLNGRATPLAAAASAAEMVGQP